MRISKTILTVVFILSLAAFLFGFVLHLLTYAGVDARDFMPVTWYSFQIATALLFIPIMISGFRENRGIPRTYVAPNFLQLLFGIFLIYTAFNFLFSNLFLNHGSTPEIINNQYVMTAHGSASPITKAEYLTHRAYEARANSGHWMALWSWAAIWCFDYIVTRAELLRHSPTRRSHSPKAV